MFLRASINFSFLKFLATERLFICPPKFLKFSQMRDEMLEKPHTRIRKKEVESADCGTECCVHHSSTACHRTTRSVELQPKGARCFIWEQEEKCHIECYFSSIAGVFLLKGLPLWLGGGVFLRMIMDSFRVLLHVQYNTCRFVKKMPIADSAFLGKCKRCFRSQTVAPKFIIHALLWTRPIVGNTMWHLLGTSSRLERHPHRKEKNIVAWRGHGLKIRSISGGQHMICRTLHHPKDACDYSECCLMMVKEFDRSGIFALYLNSI